MTTSVWKLARYWINANRYHHHYHKKSSVTAPSVAWDGTDTACVTRTTLSQVGVYASDGKQMNRSSCPRSIHKPFPTCSYHQSREPESAWAPSLTHQYPRGLPVGSPHWPTRLARSSRKPRRFWRAQPKAVYYLHPRAGSFTLGSARRCSPRYLGRRCLGRWLSLGRRRG